MWKLLGAFVHRMTTGVEGWFTDLMVKIKAYLVIYLIVLVICRIIGIVLFFYSGFSDVNLSTETLTTNGSYVLQTSFFQGIENNLFGNIQAVLSNTRKAIVFNEIFRATAILVSVLAVTLMGFTMLIGDQKITIKEFFWDIFLIFGSTSILLYYDPTLSVDPNAPASPEKYITLIYNFLLSISNFISETLFSTVKGMNISYKDHTPVGYYAPLDVVSSLFTDSEISWRFLVKFGALMLSEVFVLVPLIIIVCAYFLIPVVLTTFVAILLAKVTIMFALQFLPFFILFSSINDVNVKINKQSKGLDFTTKLITQGIVEPLMFLALTTFVVGFLMKILIVDNINEILSFSVMSVDLLEPLDCQWWNVVCHAKNLFFKAFNVLLPKVAVARDISMAKFFSGTMQLFVGIFAFKQLYPEISSIMQNLMSRAPGTGSAASGIFESGGGLYEKKNVAAGIVGETYGSAVHSTLKGGFGYDNEKGTINSEEGAFTKPFTPHKDQTDVEVVDPTPQPTPEPAPSSGDKPK